LCANAACCFLDQVECGADVHLDCANYAACHVVHHGDVTVKKPPTKQEVDDACENHSQNSVNGQLTLCEQVCQVTQVEVGPCCFGHVIGGEYCRLDVASPAVAAYCETYVSCSVVFPETTGSGTPGGIVESPPQPSANLAVVCADTAQRPTCIEDCSVATCCHAGSLPETCVHVHPGIVCDDFSPCNVLYGL
jgi:hypothetical protein